jgi:SAM-dependent methyltransferase
VLSLEPLFHRASDAFNHLGLRVEGVRAVRDVQTRLRELGLVRECEDGVECCYSMQTKFWIADPDKNLWEIYTVTGELPHRGALSSSDALVARDRSGDRAVWEHRLGEELPARERFADESVDEARLKGSFNAQGSREAWRALVEEAYRVVRPGGYVLSHGLVSDRPLPNGFPRLPGPAALVREAPLETEPFEWLRAAGFVQLYAQKLSESAHFTHDGARMRELLVFGYKPAPAPEAPAATRVIYRGPFASVTDDGGQSFPRGQAVVVDRETLARLRCGPTADQFAFLRGPEPTS